MDLFVARRVAVAAGKSNVRGQPPAFTSPADVLAADLEKRVGARAHSGDPLVERLALHWMNHFTASSIAFVGFFIPDYEDFAVRPHMFGPFEDLLIAAVTHPAMLLYLDNAESIGPRSPRGQARRRGLNENLAREIMELHVLGVDGGYRQADVTELALALTGWTFNKTSDPIPYARRMAFADAMHEPGSRTVLSKIYPAEGSGQVISILRDLARTPAAASFVTKRLLRHFVGDGASDDLARSLARTYLDSQGHLGEVTKALVRSNESWRVDAAKIRSPLEFLMCSARLLEALPPRPSPIVALKAMGQPYMTAPAPNGWPEGNNDWAAPDSLKSRLDWTAQVSANLSRTPSPANLIDRAFGDTVSPSTSEAVLGGATAAQSLTLLLMSPEFQRR